MTAKEAHYGISTIMMSLKLRLAVSGALESLSRNSGFQGTFDSELVNYRLSSEILKVFFNC